MALKERDELLESATARLDQLTKENTLLKQQLQEAIEASRQRRPYNTTGANDAESTPRVTDEEPDWKAEYAKVGIKHKALAENFKRAKEALLKRRDERDKWIEHATLLEKRVRAAEEEHDITILDRNQNRKIRETSHMQALNGGSKVDPNTSFATEGGLEQVELELPPLAAAAQEEERGGVDSATQTINPITESTQGESSSPRPSYELPPLPVDSEISKVRIKEEPSSDGPVVVMERAVKKRKRDEPGTVSVVRRVKAEPVESSSPLQPLGSNSSDLQESIDLGEVVQRLFTPKKRKEAVDVRLNNELAGELLAAARSTSGPLFVKPDKGLPSTRPAQFPSALTPVSINTKIPRTEGYTPVSSIKPGLSHRITALAEDGGFYSEDREEKTGKNPCAIGTTPQNRLNTLMNSPSTSDEPTIARPSKRIRGLSRQDGRMLDDLAVPQRRELPFERERDLRDKSDGRSTPVTTRPGISSLLTPAQEARSPLAHKKSSSSLIRNKPPSELRLDDFKINPLVNDGHDYAFTEVVRGKDDRACLPGCTDMHCCGKQFRALALSQRPNPPLTATQRQEEQKLLEDYLGDYAYRLATMSKEERSDLWIEAKTQELANKYSKHRHRYSRMRSPPGFWNADFPSTQELEADREEAAKRERQAIQERYREAMRSGGRWLFRDE